nr:hypothetical protein [Streptomyces sp. S1D4-11]
MDGFQITAFPAKPDGGATARPAACRPLENMRTAAPARTTAKTAVVVVRSGATVVLFHTASGTGSSADVPEALVSAQVKKLKQA